MQVSWPTVVVVVAVLAAAVAMAYLKVPPEWLAGLAVAGTSVAGAMRAIACKRGPS
jgi:hypothetical protein